MIDECIHGLDRDRCDVCSPKVVPKVELPVRSTSRPATKSSSGPARARAATSGSPIARRTSGATKAPVDVGEQRIHHVTHVSNLAGILASGAVHSASSAHPTTDISSAGNRELRASTLIAGHEDASVADFVPFYLSPNASLWQAVRAESTDPRLTAAARGLAASEFVILVSTLKAQPGDGVVVTDGDAADPRSRFATTPEAAERMLRRLVTDDETDAVLRAELLVKGSVPFESVTVIGVANDRSRDAVKEIVAGSGFRPRIAVHPPWFALPSDD